MNFPAIRWFSVVFCHFVVRMGVGKLCPFRAETKIPNLIPKLERMIMLVRWRKVQMWLRSALLERQVCEIIQFQVSLFFALFFFLTRLQTTIIATHFDGWWSMADNMLLWNIISKSESLCQNRLFECCGSIAGYINVGVRLFMVVVVAKRQELAL